MNRKLLSTELNWGRIWAKRWHILVALLCLYLLGFTVNSGVSMNGLGWVYFHLWGTQPIRDGQVFVFAPANEPSWCKFVPRQQWVKRRVGIDQLGNIIFKGDNENWSTDNRDGLRPVPPNHIAGVVVAAWSPTRMKNWFSPTGRLKNNLTLNYCPTWLKFSGRFAAAWSPETNTTKVFVDGAEKQEFPGWSMKSEWRTDTILLGKQNGDVWSFMSFNPTTNRVTKNLDSEGNLDLSDQVSVTFRDMAVSGGLVYALDNNPGTSWIVGPTKPKNNLSQLTFYKPFTGKVKFCGTIVSGTVLSVAVNDGSFGTPMPPWKAETIELQDAKRIQLLVSKIDEAGMLTWKVTSVEFLPQ